MSDRTNTAILLFLIVVAMVSFVIRDKSHEQRDYWEPKHERCCARRPEQVRLLAPTE